MPSAYLDTAGRAPGDRAARGAGVPLPVRALLPLPLLRSTSRSRRLATLLEALAPSLEVRRRGRRWPSGLAVRESRVRRVSREENRRLLTGLEMLAVESTSCSLASQCAAFWARARIQRWVCGGVCVCLCVCVCVCVCGCDMGSTHNGECRDSDNTTAACGTGSKCMWGWGWERTSQKVDHDW